MTLPMVVDLTVPVKAYGESVTKLTFRRRPNLGDLRATDGLGDSARIVVLVSRLADIPESSAEQIDVVDLEAVGAVVADFFVPTQSPRTGPT